MPLEPNATPLRVLHLNSLLTGGGTDDRSVRIAHALGNLGHKMWMGGPPGRQYSKIAQELGITFEPLPLGPLKLPLIIHTARFLRREHVQIIHARHGRDYWPAIFSARLSGVRPKIVLSRHLAKSPGSWVSRRFLLSQCDALVAVSQFVAKVLREGHSDPQSNNPERHFRPPMLGDHSKIRVVYGGFDMSRFIPADASAQRKAWGLEPHHYAFGVVGGYSLPRGKGQPEFLRAAAKIKAQAPNARFLIIGRGNMKPRLEGMIQELGLHGTAWLTPYCSDIAAGMNALDCMVLPQVGTEALPGVMIEAQACGKPVIASDLDGIAEAFVVSHAQLVRPGSVDELARAMGDWSRRPSLPDTERWEMHKRVAERFSLERAAKELVALYGSL